MDYAVLKDTILKLKKQIIRTEVGDAQLSETDTRQGLINPFSFPLPGITRPFVWSTDGWSR